MMLIMFIFFSISLHLIISVVWVLTKIFGNYNSVQDSDDNNNDDGDDDDDLLKEGPFEVGITDASDNMLSEVLINDSNPIMVCSNAMNKKNKCVFCKCYKCHMKQVESEDNRDQFTTNENNNDSKRTRHLSRRVQKSKNVEQGQVVSKRSARNMSKSCDVQKCNHVDDLTFFTDSSFFSRSYKMRNEKINNSAKDKVFLPTKCSLCQFEIVNSISKRGKKNIQ